MGIPLLLDYCYAIWVDERPVGDHSCGSSIRHPSSARRISVDGDLCLYAVDSVSNLLDVVFYVFIGMNDPVGFCILRDIGEGNVDGFSLGVC